MCLHLMIGAVSRCCQRYRPGHENDDRWLWKIYWVSGLLMGVLIILLIVLSFVLEWGRERGWSSTKSLTRQHTAIPLVIACGLMLLSVLELICLYPNISMAMKRSRVGAIEEDVYATEFGSPNGDEESDDPNKRSRREIFTINGGEDEDDGELSPAATDYTSRHQDSSVDDGTVISDEIQRPSIIRLKKPSGTTEQTASATTSSVQDPHH